MSYYAEKDFFDDPALLELVQQVLSGNLTLKWYEVETTRVRARPADPARGLTYQDCNLGPYGYDAIPEFLRDADSFAEASLALHLQAEGMVLTLFRFSEYISPTEGDKKLFRLVMQDEARHVGYGMQHLKWVLDHFPERRELIHHHLDEAENFVFGGGYATEVLEPFIILSGKGLKKENIAEGVRITNAFQLKQADEYFERLAKCGLPERRERSRLWKMIELRKQSMAA